MFLGIAIAAIILIAGIFFIWKFDCWPVIIPIILLMVFIIAAMDRDAQLNIPTSNDAQYYTSVQNSRIYFNEYSKSEESYIIPSHYYLKRDWINNWVYCESPMEIATPRGTDLRIHNTPITDEPYVKQGSIECK